MTFGESVVRFVKNLEIGINPPTGTELLLPFRESENIAIIRKFYNKFYNDKRERISIFGINPGRHGAGTTGIPFTDPVMLQSKCGIENDFPKRGELSSEFVYKVIEAYGGAEPFYSRFYITSVCPVGFIRNGKNLNYYDDKKLEASLMDFIAGSITRQVGFGINRDLAFCLGEGRNYKYLAALNARQQIFKRIVPMAHPRYIMQYRRMEASEFIEDYLIKLSY